MFTPIRLFSKAGATGHVFLLKNGACADKGLAYSGFIGFKTTVAVVPTTPQILDFSVEARTQDKQGITVTGNIKVTLNPVIAVSKFDFTVNPHDGAYQNAWEQTLRAIVIEQVLAPIHDKAKTLDVEAATQSHKDFQDAVHTKVTDENSPLKSRGIIVESCSITKVEADDEDVTDAIGVQEREKLLTDADAARHDRRLKASENERIIKQYEADTKLELEKKQAALLVEQGKNKETEAQIDAKATKIRLAPLKDVESGKLLGAALLEAAKGGRLGSVNITSEFLAAAGQK